MTLYGLVFYVVAATVVAATAIAITRRNLVHAVVYLIISFFGTAMLFYLLGAPLLAAFEVIVYAGAIMVLFLFVVMMTKVESSDEPMFPPNQMLPAVAFGGLYGVVGFLMIRATPGSDVPLRMLTASPKEFALYVFQYHWLNVEIISLLLLVALIGTLHLAKGREKNQPEGEI
jgi:NADH-quinone oxidoreductase subunit J